VLTADQVTTAGADDAAARAAKVKIRKASAGGAEARQ
jgi:hypothetical protein